MPTFDKPEWLRHNNNAIHGVDIDPSGERLATCGADHKVRIWAMRPILSEAVEMDPAVPKQLAVLQDSISCVNCVRFSPNGKLIASGSDDNDAFIHELREGRGFTVFGSTEAANVENWRLKVRLRGHEAIVSDLAWSPSSTRLATASIDNKVKIWDAGNGLCVRVLEGHAGHVKGVAWDPFDRFLASQGDREVIIWRLEDGARVATIDEPFKNAPIASFALRPAWSPDGQLLTVPNGYDKGMHTTRLISRNSWRPNDFQLMGHTAPVIAVRYNPRMFLPRKQPGGGSAAAEDDAASSVLALGANDKQFSIWNPSESLPVCVGRNFFRRMIVDMAWSPDGRTLVIAAYDGTVTVATFAPGELGKEVPEHEFQQLLAQLYGDPQLRNQKAALTAAPDLLQLEERARNDVQREQALRDRLGASEARAAGAGAGVGVGVGAGGPAAGAAGRLPLAGGVAAAAPGLEAAAPVRQQQQPPLTQVPQNTQLPAPNRSASPAKAGPGRPGGAGAGRDPDHPPAKRITVQPIGGPAQGPGAAGPGGGLRPAPAVTAGMPGAGPSGGPGGAGADRAQAAGAAPAPVVLVPPDPVKPCIAMAIHVQGAPGEHRLPLELQAHNAGTDARGRPTAELVCVAGPARQWSDSVQGHIVSLAGSSRVAAVSTTNGDLLVYSSAGRRLLPPIRLGWPAAMLWVAPGSALLLALLADARLMVWDVAAGQVQVEASAAPLLTGPGAAGLRVTSARLSSAGQPLLVLSNGHAYVHHGGMRSWMRVADDAFPASAFTSNLTSPTAGELSRLQASAAQQRHPHDVIATAAAHAVRPGAAARSEQAALEQNLAAAAALRSPAEWRLWLITYVRRLAADGDQGRLRDLIAELLGPLRWSDRDLQQQQQPVGDAGLRAPGAGAAAHEPALASSLGGRWQPTILGYDKRKLLREVVLKEASKNRANQQLVAEVLDQLKQLEAGLQSLGGAAAVGAAANGVGSQLLHSHNTQQQQQQHHHQPMALG